MEKDDLVTLNELFDIIKPYCEKKIQRDTIKGNPLTIDIFYLINAADDELDELFHVYYDDLGKDIEEEKHLNEIADCINYLLFIVGKVKNYKIFLR